MISLRTVVLAIAAWIGMRFLDELLDLDERTRAAARSLRRELA